MYNRNAAFVLGMFETGLGVGRSLGRKGIRVIGIDFKKDIGFYSRYINGKICPHPLHDEANFLNFLTNLAHKQKEKPVVLITSDDFLAVVSRNRRRLEDCLLINLPDEGVISSVSNKYRQFVFAERIGIPCPKTYFPNSIREVDEIKNGMDYPVFVKAQDVNLWRKHVSSSIKGFVVCCEKDLLSRYESIIKKGAKAIVQEIVRGPDTNHFKICCYISKKGEFLLVFTLQKIRQLPIQFGVGSVVRSVHYPKLVKIGTKFFTGMGYRGVGSAEFKLDEKDNELKLIELNPRYWQQNSLSEKCGMNFPYVDYLEATGQNPSTTSQFRSGIKWANIYMDFQSFLSYHRQKQLTLKAWVNSMKGVKILSDFAADDVLPCFYESRFGSKLMKIPQYLLNELRNGNN